MKLYQLFNKHITGSRANPPYNEYRLYDELIQIYDELIQIYDELIQIYDELIQIELILNVLLQ